MIAGNTRRSYSTAGSFADDCVVILCFISVSVNKDINSQQQDFLGNELPLDFVSTRGKWVSGRMERIIIRISGTERYVEFYILIISRCVRIVIRR